MGVLVILRDIVCNILLKQSDKDYSNILEIIT